MSSHEILSSENPQLVQQSPNSAEEVLSAGPRCRICLDLGTADNILIRPCACSGSVAHVHENCLKTWISERPDVHNVCELCKTTYNLELKYKMVLSIKKGLSSPAGVLTPLLLPMLVIFLLTTISVADNLSDPLNLTIFIIGITGDYCLLTFMTYIFIKHCFVKKTVDIKVLNREQIEDVN